MLYSVGVAAVFDLSKKQWGVADWRAPQVRDARIEAPSKKRQSRKGRGAAGAEVGGVWKGGIPSPADYGVWRSIVPVANAF